jgi:hypothetical protein
MAALQWFVYIGMEISQTTDIAVLEGTRFSPHLTLALSLDGSHSNSTDNQDATSGISSAAIRLDRIDLGAVEGSLLRMVQVSAFEPYQVTSS